jgi:hypothetical protein
MYIGFIHIPKTGGMTIANHMAQINHVVSNGVLGKTNPDAELLARAVHGSNYERYEGPHIAYTGTDHHFVHEFDVHEEDIQMVTFLRDPIERCYSYMNMVVRNPENIDRCHLFESPTPTENGKPLQWLGPLDPASISVERWRNLIYNSFALNNAMCWQLGMPHDPNWTANRLKQRAHSPPEWGVPPLYATEELYENAIKNLEKSFYVGDFANFEHDAKELINRVCATYNVELKYELEHANKHSYDKNIPPEIKSLLIEMNQYDIKLYEYCKKHFFSCT